MRTRTLLFAIAVSLAGCDQAATTAIEVDPEPAVVDLVVRALNASDRSGPGRELKVSVEWENVGDTTSSGTGVHRLLLVGEAGEVEIARWMGPALAPGEAAVRDTTLDLPDDLDAGTYALRVQLHDGIEPDSTREDNRMETAVELVRLPDLSPGAFAMEASRTPDLRIQIATSLEVLNLGNGEPSEIFVLRFYFSEDDVLDENDIAMGGGTMLKVSKPYERTGSYPADYIAPGTYHVFVVVDDEDVVEEWDETNNVGMTVVVIPPAS